MPYCLIIKGKGSMSKMQVRKYSQSFYGRNVFNHASLDANSYVSILTFNLDVLKILAMENCIFMDDDVLKLKKNSNCMAVHCPDAIANINACK